MREIKFRAWTGDRMVNPACVGEYGEWYRTGLDYENGRGDKEDLMQFTGLKDKNGKEIYEGDIFRIEESTDEGTDFFIYVVITWVQEWCMFATLRVEDEYPGYLKDGIKALDEPMFWTYTLEDTNSRKHFLCGNIYENSDLL